MVTFLNGFLRFHYSRESLENQGLGVRWVELGTGKVKILKEGSWEAVKLGTWELERVFVVAGVIA